MLKPFHLAAAFASVVSACGSYQGQFYAQGCLADAAERVQAADWARVKTITIRVRRDEFEPMIISLTQDRPYVMRLENGDRASHVFRAPDFFKAIAMESATVGGRELAEDCPVRVVLEAEETAEFRFVAVRDGHYNFVDSLLPFMSRGGPGGVIVIEPRRTFTIGTLYPVKIEEPVPAAPAQPPAPVETAPNPFDTYEPPADDAGAAAPDAEPNPFDAVMPAPGDSGAAAPDEAPSPFDVVEPAPAEGKESSPFDAVEPAPAEGEAPGPMVQTMPPGEPAPAPDTEDGTDPFGALEPDRTLPME